jgi:hypothetical protein
MNKILKIAILAGLGYGAWRLFLRREPDKLDEHLAEQKTLKDIGRITTRGTILAKDAYPPTRQQPGPLAGAVAAQTNNFGGFPSGMNPWMQ